MRRVLAVCLLLLVGAPARADIGDCRDAMGGLRSARSDIASALKTYTSCIAKSDGHEDCSFPFSTLQSAQDDFESAVSEYELDCD